MDRQTLLALLDAVASGATAPEAAADLLAGLPAEPCGDVRADTGRAARQGFPEVIYCEGKSGGQIRDAARAILAHSDVLLATRADAQAYQAIAQAAEDARYHEQPRLVVVDRRPERPAAGHVVVVTGGTADTPVAEEAAVSAEVMGNRVTRLYDVGVSGLHRVLAVSGELRTARVVIVVAGMEGALPSVVAGLVACPVIGVPTSVGYGTSFGGVAPLLAMLNSCAPGVAVVNIDNGFGAARVASMVNLLDRPQDISEPEGPGQQVTEGGAHA